MSIFFCIIDRKGDFMQRYFAKEKQKNLFVLDSLDIHHIKNVMRMKDGDLIEVVYHEQLYLCELHNIDTQIEVLLKEKKQIEKTFMPEVILIIPLLKEQKMDLILQKATELGVYRIVPIITTRSIIKWDDKKQDKKIERWHRICKEASEQSHRLEIPKIEKVQTISQLVNLEGVKFVCSTVEKNRNLKKVLKNKAKCDKLNIVIGPEGGFSSLEEEQLNEIGFESITLGNRIMRVETVPMFVLSIINYEFME